MLPWNRLAISFKISAGNFYAEFGFGTAREGLKD